MNDLRKDSSVREKAYQYDYTFKRVDGRSRETTFTTDTAEKTITDRLAWEEFSDELGERERTVRNKWEIDKVGISFHVAYWNSYQGLADTISGFDCVGSARLVRALQGNYSPAKIRVRPLASKSKTDVVNKVNEHHSGLLVEVEQNKVIVYPSPIVHFQS